MADPIKPHKCPVGTIRQWQVGTVIKAHEGSIFDSGWMKLTDLPAGLERQLKAMDVVGREITAFKEPVSGEVWLEKILSEFQSPSGTRYSLQQFKQFAGWFGAANYSFRNTFSMIFVGDKIQLKSDINDAILEENYRRFGQNKYLNLSKDEIKAIKERVIRDFKYTGGQFYQEDVDALEKQLLEVKQYLTEGESPTGENKVAYDECKAVMDTFCDSYDRLKNKNQLMRDTLKRMNDQFGNNWGIIESFRRKFVQKMDEYVRKYSDQIRKDELTEFETRLGVPIDSSISDFYGALKSNKIAPDINIHDFVGKMVPDPYKAFHEVKLLEIKKGTDWNGNEFEYPVIYDSTKDIPTKSYHDSPDVLKSMIKKLQTQDIVEFKIPLQIRWNLKYGKAIDGPWEYQDIASLETLERVIEYLPPAHVKQNNSLKEFTKHTSFKGPGYAWYDPTFASITFTGQSIKESQLAVSDFKGEVFPSVVIHEIGHAVSRKLQGRNFFPYREFTYECGWDWDQLRGRSVHATGNDKKIPRQSVHSRVPLITDYATVSPEEAFAEYYSFFAQHKNSIEAYLKTDDKHHLEKATGFSTKKLIDTLTASGGEPKTINDVIDTTFYGYDPLKNAAMHDLMATNNRNLDHHVTLNNENPWKVTKEVKGGDWLTSDNVELKQALNTTKQIDDYPIFSVVDNHGNHSIPVKEDYFINEANKYRKRQSVTFSLSREVFEMFLAHDYTIPEIKHFASQHLGDKPMPVAKTPDAIKQSIEHGLTFHGHLISSEIIEKNKKAFVQMAKIWHSEELKKALAELNMNTLEKSLSSIFSSAIDKIKEAIGSDTKQASKNYADVLVFCEDKLLLLKRASHDSFMPNKWCLPGGKVESGENGTEAAVRELNEETGIQAQSLQFIKDHPIDGGNINYNLLVLDSLPEITLDSNEHDGYEWIDVRNIDDYDCILDLGDRLKDMIDFESDEPEIFEDDSVVEVTDIHDAFDFISKAFDQNLITGEQYVEALGKYQLLKAKKEDLNVTEEGDFIAADHPEENDIHEGTGMSTADLKEHAMEATEEQLMDFIKKSPDPQLRKIAHEELDRRLKEEHVQEGDQSGSKESVLEGSMEQKIKEQKPKPVEKTAASKPVEKEAVPKAEPVEKKASVSKPATDEKESTKPVDKGTGTIDPNEDDKVNPFDSPEMKSVIEEGKKTLKAGKSEGGAKNPFTNFEVSYPDENDLKKTK